MNDNIFLEKFADILEVDKSEVDSEFQLTNGVLDSIAVIDVMALIDKHYGVSISGQEINNCASVRELLSLVHRKIED